MSDYKFMKKYLKYKSKYNNLKYGGSGSGSYGRGEHRFTSAIDNREKFKAKEKALVLAAEERKRERQRRIRRDERAEVVYRREARAASLQMPWSCDFNEHLHNHVRKDDISNLSNNHMYYGNVSGSPTWTLPPGSHHYLFSKPTLRDGSRSNKGKPRVYDESGNEIKNPRWANK